MRVIGDIVFVDGWYFEVDRSVPKIDINHGKDKPISIQINKVNGTYAIVQLDTQEPITEYDIYINGEYYQKQTRK